MNSLKQNLTMILLLVSTNCCPELKSLPENKICNCGKIYEQCAIRNIGPNNSERSICPKANGKTDDCYKISYENNQKNGLNNFCATETQITTLINSKLYKQNKYHIQRVESKCDLNTQDGLYC